MGQISVKIPTAAGSVLSDIQQTRVLRLTLLAPDIIEAILDGKQGPELMLAKVLEPFPLDWAKQRRARG